MKYTSFACALLLLVSCASELPRQQEKPASFTVLDAETPPRFPEHWRIAVSSDPHILSKSSNRDATRNILMYAESEHSKGRLDAFLILGDFVDNGGDSKAWFAVQEEFGSFAPTLPILGIAGNHDTYGFGLPNWHAVIRRENKTTSTPYWRLDVGDTHFLGLFLPWSFHDFDAKQRTWLEAQLAEIPSSDFVVILSHSFFYASGYYDFWSGGAWYDNKGNLAGVAPVFRNKADLVISGHNHYMEWIEQDGIAWAIIGAMGGKPDPVPTYTSGGSAFFRRQVYGFLMLERGEAGLICSFIDESGAMLFSRTLRKN